MKKIKEIIIFIIFFAFRGMSEYKIAVLGDSGVGKTSCIIQYVQNIFADGLDETMEDSYRKMIDINGNTCLLDIHDTCGEETAIMEGFVRGIQGFILMYSITSPDSLSKLSKMRDNIVRIKDVDSVPIVLVGNKSDLKKERIVSLEQGQKLSTAFACPHFESSAKERINIEELFIQITNLIIHYNDSNSQIRTTK